MKRIIIVFIILCSGAGYSGQARQGFYFEQKLDGQINPLGVMSDSKLFYRIPLSASKDMLFENSRIDLGVMDWLTPTDNLLGLYFDFEPIAFFDIALKGGYYGLFDGMNLGFMPINSPKEPFNPDSVTNLQHLTRSGMWWIAIPTLKAKFWNIIIANSLAVNYMNLNYSGYYVDLHSDSILRGEDTYLQNDTYGLYEWSPQFLTGLNHYYLFVPNSAYVSQRLSAMVIYKPALDWFYDTYLIVFAGSYFQDHYYMGKLYMLAQAGFVIKL